MATAALLIVASVTFCPADAARRVPTCDSHDATIIGKDRSETIQGTANDDVIVGLGGNDVIYGNGGDDITCELS